MPQKSFEFIPKYRNIVKLVDFLNENDGPGTLTESQVIQLMHGLKELEVKKLRALIVNKTWNIEVVRAKDAFTGASTTFPRAVDIALENLSNKERWSQSN